MCGFVGYVQRASEPEHLAPMLRRVIHRGPDGEGTWSGRRGDWFVALGYRRLAIIDIAGGAQPMATPSDSAQLTYNGELYNFAPLKEALQRRGTAFRTRSDTEVLLHHVETHGSEGLSVLNGMFAFAQWDQARGRLLLARDRVGIKPLYYAPLPDGGVAFASELTALMQHPGVDRRLSAAGLEAYFFSDYVAAPLTLIEGARKLPPGHFMQWEDGRLSEPRAFFDLSPAHDTAVSAHPKELARDLWGHLRSAVGRQMMSDVPVGVFLSGGIDSSTVATLAQEYAGHPL